MRRLVLGLAIGAMVGTAHVGAAGELSLWPAAEIGEAYDNNVRLTSTNRKGDFLTVESLGATLATDTAARNFFLTYDTVMLEHVSYPGQDRFGRDHYVGLRDYEKISPTTSLSVSESFLVGNAASGSILTNGSTPIGSQLMQSLFSNFTSRSNVFAMDLSSRYSNSLTWSANVHQTFFSASSSSASGDSFNQGGLLRGDWLVAGRFTAGLGYDFEDFRFSNSKLPTTESNWPQVRLGWGEATPFSLRAQLGGIISISTSGVIGTTPASAQTTVDVAYLVAATYTGRRLAVTASASQLPTLSAGFGAFATSQLYSGLVRYALTRRATLFANSGYYEFSGSGTSGHSLSYAGGISYRLTEFITLNAQYLGYRNLASGSTASSLVAVPGRQTTTDFFLIGLTFTPRPLKWEVL